MLHLSLSPISALLSIPSASTSFSDIVFVLYGYAYYQSFILAFGIIFVQAGYQWFDLIWNAGYFSQGEKCQVSVGF